MSAADHSSRSLDTAIVAASLLLYSLIAAPIPALNEPHYLAKAKHFWQPAWCAGDFFLESADAHTVFFVTLGWLTTWCSLATTALVGRVIALTVLAWGWTALARALARSPAFSELPGFCIAGGETDCKDRLPALRKTPAVGFAVWSVWLFLALATCGNWSGEWLVGGVESKVITYGCLLWAWSQLPDSRWFRSALAIGVGIAFHPVVGLWGLLATLGALVFLPPRPPSSVGEGWGEGDFPRLPAEAKDTLTPGPSPTEDGGRGGKDAPDAAHLKCAAKRLSWHEWVIAGAIIVVLALPGLVPVLRIVLEPVDAATRYAGTFLQVYYRLGHHLDPMLFPLRAHLGYAGLTAVWLLLWKFGPRGPAWSWLHRITLWSLVFALAGLAVGWGPRPADKMPGFAWRMHLLKFYPFRLADALLPLTVALQTAWLLSRWLSEHRVPLALPVSAGAMAGSLANVKSTGGASGTRRAVAAVLFALLVFGTLLGANRLVQNQRYTRAHNTDWIAACHWVRDHAPAEALVIAPHGNWTFKWYGERPEFANFKDCPQDVRGIVEWNRRQLLLTKWYHTRFDDDGVYSAGELRELAELTGATHLIADELGPIDAPTVYQNATHRVYDLQSLAPTP